MAGNRKTRSPTALKAGIIGAIAAAYVAGTVTGWYAHNSATMISETRQQSETIDEAVERASFKAKIKRIQVLDLRGGQGQIIGERGEGIHS